MCTYVCIYTVRQWICLPLVHLAVFSQLHSCQICFVSFFRPFFCFFFLLCPLFFLAHLPVVLIIYVCSTSLCWCVDAVLQRRASSFVPPQSPSRVSFCPFAVFFDCIAFCCVWMRVRVYMCVHLFVLFGPLLAHFVVAVHFWAVSVDSVDVLLFGRYFD